ncbi:MAG: hypothetical protein LBG92_04260 [Prevotellaceae bacterium]|jgi:carbon monoxide dehydrogenase subunit G|nr:hypothetical protein [Prevotellaceae bacterium]
MQEFISETVKISRSSEFVFTLLSDMSMLSKAVSSAQIKEIEDFQSDADSCSFRVKGVEAGIQIIDREPYKTIKYTGYKNIPFDFFVWIQLKEIAPDDTRMRIVLRAKLNFMMKTMFSGKIKNGLNQVASQLAASLNVR